MNQAKSMPFLILACLCGCGRMEWNWDWAWWQAPRRVVQPTRTDAHNHERAPTITRPTEESPAASGGEETSGQSPATRELVRSRQDRRPFYQLYLVCPGVADEERADQTVNLKFARARPCAMLLEMLSVPVGRSGNPEKCYLLYEDRGEFQEAFRLAALLDVQAVMKPAPSAGPEDAFTMGVGLMLTVVDQGAVVDSSLVSAATKRLTEAMQAESLDKDRRWAAAVLGSRLMSEYRYDNGAARLMAQEGEALAPPSSQGQFTAMYWRADALAKDGKSSEAGVLYQEIGRQYGPRTTGSQIVRQPKAAAKTKK